MPTATLTADRARANLALASALERQKRHERHRRKDGRRCAWCDGADKAVADARAAVQRAELAATAIVLPLSSHPSAN